MALSPVEEFFHKISQDGDLEQLKKMVNSKDGEDCQKTPLHKAAECGNLEMVKILIQMGADLDAKNDYGGTPLHYSAFLGKAQVAEYLIQMGAQTQSSCNYGIIIMLPVLGILKLQRLFFKTGQI